jgi:UDP-glucose 4-epimerase
LHLARNAALGTVNIGTGVGRSVSEIAYEVAKSLGRKIKVTGVDKGPPGALVADTHRLRALLSASSMNMATRA